MYCMQRKNFAAHGYSARLMKLRYVTVDVFTDRQFGGNPLAVVLDGESLTDRHMQAIAREFNYSETTFVLPSKNPDNAAHVRIFTPVTELPFAGHPSVGTAYAIARHTPEKVDESVLRLEMIAGVVPVELRYFQGQVIGGQLTAPEMLKRGSVLPAAEVAGALNLQVSDLRVEVHEPQIVSVGLPFLVAEVGTRDALRRATANPNALGELLPRDGADSIYFYTRDVAFDEPTCDVSARMFIPFIGVTEDPATGSATAAAAALLAECAAEPHGTFTLRFLQGVDMGRPSQLMTEVDKREGKAQRVRVGGRCVQVMEGAIEI